MSNGRYWVLPRISVGSVVKGDILARRGYSDFFLCAAHRGFRSGLQARNGSIAEILPSPSPSCTTHMYALSGDITTLLKGGLSLIEITPLTSHPSVQYKLNG